MVDASVGFQCPECVAEGRATSTQSADPYGGQPVRKATVTQVLIGINLVVFVLELVAGLDTLVSQWGMAPAAVSLGGEWWRLLTAAFLHGGFCTSRSTCMCLDDRSALESLFGHVRYLTLYCLPRWRQHRSYAFGPINSVSVGASGAIFGLMAALIVAGRSMRADVTQIVILLGINIVIGFIAPGIDWRAHLGGAVVGALVAAIMAYAPKQSRTLWQTLGVLAVAGVLVGMLMVRTAWINTQVAPAVVPGLSSAPDVGELPTSSSNPAARLRSSTTHPQTGITTRV